MNQIETGAIDSVIAPSLSTFAQSPSDLFNALEILSRHRTALIGLKENFYFDPADIVFSQLLSVLAQMKNDLLAEKVRGGMRESRLRGNQIGRARSRNDILIHSLLDANLSYREIAKIAGCSPGTVAESKKTRV